MKRVYVPIALLCVLGVGVQAPITDARDFDVRPLFDLVYEYVF